MSGSFSRASPTRTTTSRYRQEGWRESGTIVPPSFCCFHVSSKKKSPPEFAVGRTLRDKFRKGPLTNTSDTIEERISVRSDYGSPSVYSFEKLDTSALEARFSLSFLIRVAQALRGICCRVHWVKPCPLWVRVHISKECRRLVNAVSASAPRSLFKRVISCSNPLPWATSLLSPMSRQT